MGNEIIGDPAIAIGILTVVVGTFSLLNSALNNSNLRRIAARERASQLYNEYYTPEHYRQIVLPVIRLQLKWVALPPEQREAYRTAVRCGWIGFGRDDRKLLKAFVGDDHLFDDAEEAHFRAPLDGMSFTEHESLTVFLYFWTKVDAMLEAKLLERKTTVRLMRRPYRYAQRFLAELREDMAQHGRPDEIPAWFEATKRLDRVLGS
jgi:hypothetical protein